MEFEVFLGIDAERDVEEIHRYIADDSSQTVADRIVSALEETCLRLSRMPERGNIPKELRAIGISDFREVHSGNFRIIYKIDGSRVVVYCVLDGRRDMQSLLQRRLLR